MHNSRYLNKKLLSELSKVRYVFTQSLHNKHDEMVWLVGFYGISTFVGYLTPNPFLCSQCILQPQLTGQYTELNVKEFFFK